MRLQNINLRILRYIISMQRKPLQFFLWYFDLEKFQFGVGSAQRQIFLRFFEEDNASWTGRKLRNCSVD